MRALTESELAQAYAQLFFCADEDRGQKHIALAQFGAYEVRMRETSADELSFQLELYAHHTDDVIDSNSCRDFSEAVPIAEELILWAMSLNRRCRRH